MLTQSLILILAAAGLLEARSVHEVRHLHNLVHKRQADSTVLAADAIQTGSFLDGSQSPSFVAAQSKSKTSRNNFINNCVGKTITNGFQFLEGSCNGIPMGDIPSKANMVSSMITFPENGSKNIQSETTFNITVQINNIVAGVFTNAVQNYYSAPQGLQGGKIIGHTHVTVQDLGKDLNPKIPLDPTKFSFFKGINDAGNGKGLLQATVTGGLPAGNYRVCTMVAASNHQPVLMPVAQRGTADDCSKFTVIGTGTTINEAANNGAKGLAAAAAAQSAIDAGVGGKGGAATSAVQTSSASVVTSKAAPPFSNSTATGKGNGGGKGNGKTKTRNGGGGGKGVSTSPPAVQTSQAGGNVGNGGGNGGNVGKGSNTKVNNGVGKGATKVQTARTGKPTGKRIITVIETFFVFRKSRGGSCPSVKKNGNKFKVLEELFDNLASAAQAACGHQFTTCISFSGPGFSFEECTSQKNDCAAVASTQSATASTPATITASVTIPVDATATVPGSIIAVETITPSSVAAVTSAAPANNAVKAPAQTSAAGICALVTSTVTVDAPIKSSTPAALPTVIPSKAAPFSNNTIKATAKAASAPAASPVSVGSSGAIGGIAAPAIIDTGDAKRPFSVNGNSFVNKSAAIQRSCDVQFNSCANAVNGGKLSGVKLSDCSAQQTACGSQ